MRVTVRDKGLRLGLGLDLDLGLGLDLARVGVRLRIGVGVRSRSLILESGLGPVQQAQIPQHGGCAGWAERG